MDANSHLDIVNASIVPAGGYGGAINRQIEFGMRANLNSAGSTNNATNLWRSRNNRPTISRKYKNLFPYGSFSRVTGVPGSDITPNGGSSYELISGDGIYGNKCLKMILPGGSKITALSDQFNGITQKYVVSTFAVKSINPGSSSLRVSYYNAGANGTLVLNDNEWHTYCGISDVGGTSSGYEFQNDSTSTFNFLLSKLQAVAFNTYQEAADYVKSDFYALPAGDPISWYDSAIPTAGIYAKGDVIYNTAPAIGGNLGWICTEAGSPGTWRPFGTIN